MSGHNLLKDVFLGLVILIVTIWPGLLGAAVSMWVVIIAAILLIIHGLFCRSCKMHNMPMEHKESRRRGR